MSRSPLLMLPYELLSLVVQYLDLPDTRALSLACKGLQYLFHESNIAKQILEVSSVGPLSVSAPLAEADVVVVA